jgi:sec-independent protein translocase protein TatB
MFDITSSKLLILAVVALIVVGPKDLPILLRTVGKYLGVIRRQAAEFRHQFDDAMREAELDQLKKEFEAAAREVHATVESGARSIEAQLETPEAKPEPLRFGTGMSASTPPKPVETGSEAPLLTTGEAPAANPEAEKPADAASDASEHGHEPRQDSGRGAA